MLKQVFLINTDLKMDKGKIAVQVADGRSSGICYPSQYPDSDIHVEVAINRAWVRLW